MVTCVAIDNGGRHIITGSRDTTCRLWSVTHYGGWSADIDKVPLQTLYGHDREITCVAIKWELDIAISGAAVSTVNYVFDLKFCFRFIVILRILFLLFLCFFSFLSIPSSSSCCCLSSTPSCCSSSFSLSF